MEKYSSKPDQAKPKEDDFYYSINGERDGCIHALAGIICINGVSRTSQKLNSSLDLENNTENKNNIFFLAQGVDSLDKDSLGVSIGAAKRALQEYQDLSKKLKDLESQNKNSEERLSSLTESLFKIRLNNPNPFGLNSRINVFSDCKKDIISWAEVAGRATDDEPMMLDEISAAYIGGAIPGDIDIQGVFKVVTEEREWRSQIRRARSELDGCIIKFSEAMRSVFDNLSESLPETTIIALFRIIKKTKEEELIYPALFGLHNLSSEVIEILDKARHLSSTHNVKGA